MRLRRYLTRICRDESLPVVVPLMLALLLALWAIHAINGQLRPILGTVAAGQATNLMTRTINETVDDCLASDGMDYSDFVTISKNSAGEVTSLTGNTVKTNQFKREVVDAIIDRIEDLDSEELGVPLGSLTGQPLLSGLGPQVRVRVYSVGSVTADYANTFTSAGMNQTLHGLDLDITVTVNLFLPGEILPVTVHSAVRVAETVIVGDAPQTYFNLTS